MDVIRWAVKNPWILLGICLIGMALSAVGGILVDLRWFLESALFLALGAQIWIFGKRGSAWWLTLTIWMTMTYIVMLIVGLGLQALIPNE